MKKNTMEYTAPEVELVEVAVERGFTNSPLFGDEGMAGQGIYLDDIEEEF